MRRKKVDINMNRTFHIYHIRQKEDLKNVSLTL